MRPIFFLLLFLIACHDNNSDVPAITGTFDGTQLSFVRFDAKWYDGHLRFNVQTIDQKEWLLIGVTPISGPGSYPIMESTTISFIRFSTESTDYISFDSCGFFVIEKVDSSWARGSFQCRLISFPNRSDTIEVTNGRFDLKLFSTCVILYHFSDTEFFTFLKYRDISWHSDGTIYNFSAHHEKNGLYTLYVSFSSGERQIAIPWIGKEETIAFKTGCGSVPFDPLTNLSYYDSAFIAIKDSLLLPKKPGTTSVIIKNKYMIDTVALVISYKDTGLQIEYVEQDNLE